MGCVAGWMGGWFGWLRPVLVLVVLALLLWGFFFRPGRALPGMGQQELLCPRCAGAVQRAYLRCPHCGETLKTHCPSCSRLVDQGWAFCPYCSHPLLEKPGT